MSRLAQIALRDYIAYVRTPGFWLSIVLVPVGLILFGGSSAFMARTTPIPTVAVVDFTGQGYAAPVIKALETPKGGSRPIAHVVAAPGAPFSGPADAAARLRPYVAARNPRPGQPRLDAAVIIQGADQSVNVDYWSRNVVDRAAGFAAQQAVAETMRRADLAKAGVSAEALAHIDQLSPRLTDYSATAGGKASLRERVRGLAGFAMGTLLWMVVFTGAGMLLNSIIEEKSSRILEVLLTSASVPEIMGGKILGVACVTTTVLGVWLAIGGIALAVLSPEVAGDLVDILLAKGMIAYLALYFVGGYLMFATLYVTVGAFCETTREAQTLLGPMMILLSLPMIFMSQAITHPDAPILVTLSWIPIFTPFMMAARAASDPPLWQVAGTAFLMFATTAFELWVAGPAFKSGALATGRFEIRAFLASIVRRTGE